MLINAGVLQTQYSPTMQGKGVSYMASSNISISQEVQRKRVSLSFDSGWATSLTPTNLGLPLNAKLITFVSASDKWVLLRLTADENNYIALAVATSNGYVITDFSGTIEGYMYYTL